MTRATLVAGAIVIGLWLAWSGGSMGARYKLQSATTPVPPHLEERLLALDREAIDEAYKRQVRALFASWMKDHAGQPERAARGINEARKAYIDSMLAIERRSSPP